MKHFYSILFSFSVLNLFAQSYDSSFNGNGFVLGPDFFEGINTIDDPADILYEESTGKLIMMNRVGGTTLRKLNTDGSYDMTFGIDGIQEYPSVSEEYFLNVFQHDDGYWMAGRNYIDYNIHSPILMDVHADGEVNTSFGDVGINAISSIDSFIVQTSCKGTSGRIFLVGYDYHPILTNTKASMIAFNPDGSFDADFGYNKLEGFAYSSYRSVLELPDGRILASGEVQFNAGEYSSALLICFNPDGSIDETFGVEGFLFPEPDFTHNQFVIEEAKLSADGNIYAAGFVSVSGSADTREMIIKFNDQGELLSDFGEAGYYFIENLPSHFPIQLVTDAFNNLYVMAVKYLDGGSDRQTAIYKIFSTGEPDLSFTNGTPGEFLIQVPGVESYDEVIGAQMIIQPDGKLVLIGRADGISTNDDFWIVRIITNETTVAIDENKTVNTILLFPNPATDQITIEGNAIIQSAEIISIDGKTIYQKEINNLSHTFEIDHYIAGVYILRVKDAFENISQQYFVKE